MDQFVGAINYMIWLPGCRAWRWGWSPCRRAPWRGRWASRWRGRTPRRTSCWRGTPGWRRAGRRARWRCPRRPWGARRWRRTPSPGCRSGSRSGTAAPAASRPSLHQHARMQSLTTTVTLAAPWTFACARPATSYVENQNTVCHLREFLLSSML